MSNTIVRAARRHRFVIIDQRAIEDTRLSWAARGLLGYLLSRPDDWRRCWSTICANVAILDATVSTAYFENSAMSATCDSHVNMISTDASEAARILFRRLLPHHNRITGYGWAGHG